MKTPESQSQWATSLGLSTEPNGFVATLNGMGYMTANWDAIAQKGIEFVGDSGAVVLDIGAAFGLITLPLLMNGAKVIANDLDAKHLEILRKRVPSELLPNLELCLGNFSDEICIEPSSLKAVIASSVFHFLDGNTLEKGAAKIFSWLSPGGKVFASANSPYVASLKRFMPVYETSRKKGEKYPGYTNDLAIYLDSHRINQLPQAMHVLDPEVLTRAFEEAGFLIEFCDFFSREDCADDIRLDGREFVGLIAGKAV